MYDRDKLIRGITLLGVAIGVVIAAGWITGYADGNQVVQLLGLLVRIIALALFIAGVILLIIAFIPK